MLIRQNDLSTCPKNCNLYYICKRCGGKHYFYGSASPDDLNYCHLCMNDGGRQWINNIHGTKCHILAGNQATLRNPRGLQIQRNNPGPYRRR